MALLFVSYHPADELRTRQLFHALQDGGHQLVFGSQPRSVVQVQESDVLVYLLSRHTVNDEAHLRELHMAIKAHKPVLIILLETLIPYPPYLAKLPYLNLMSDMTSDKQEALLDAVHNLSTGITAEQLMRGYQDRGEDEWDAILDDDYQPTEPLHLDITGTMLPVLPDVKDRPAIGAKTGAKPPEPEPEHESSDDEADVEAMLAALPDWLANTGSDNLHKKQEEELAGWMAVQDSPAQAEAWLYSGEGAVSGSREDDEFGFFDTKDIQVIAQSGAKIVEIPVSEEDTRTVTTRAGRESLPPEQVFDLPEGNDPKIWLKEVTKRQKSIEDSVDSTVAEKEEAKSDDSRAIEEPEPDYVPLNEYRYAPPEPEPKPPTIPEETGFEPLAGEADEQDWLKEPPLTGGDSGWQDIAESPEVAATLREHMNGMTPLDWLKVMADRDGIGMDAEDSEILFDIDEISAPEHPPVAKPAPRQPAPLQATPIPPPPIRQIADIFPQFTAFWPEVVQPEEIYALIVFVHLPDSLDEVRQMARGFAGMMGQQQNSGSVWSQVKLKSGAQLMFVPQIDGLNVEPGQVTIPWQPAARYQNATFHFKVPPNSVVQDFYRGRILIFEEALILGEIPITMKVIQQRTHPEAHSYEAHLQRLEPVFASYSHTDAPVMEYFRAVREASGHKMLVDIYELRAGEQWEYRIYEMIVDSAVFQLFWSPHSAESPYVEAEWRYALQYQPRRPRFIQPVYWQSPLYPPPEELKDLHFEKIQLPVSTRLQLLTSRFTRQLTHRG